MRTERVHKEYCRINIKHTIEQTAVLLGRSYGGINEDLMIASWCRSHPKICDFHTIKEALEYIRAYKKEMKVRIV